jgi:hypothetical protein
MHLAASPSDPAALIRAPRQRAIAGMKANLNKTWNVA